MRTLLMLLCAFLFSSIYSIGQDCIGAHMTSHEAYLYGRFEVGMRSAAGMASFPHSSFTI